MRKGIKSKAVAFTLVAFMVGPLAARAEGEMTSSLQGLEARLMALEDKLAASEATIAAQQHLIRAQQPVAAEGGLDDFLQSLELGGYVEASYIYSFKNPDFNNQTQLHTQFNTDHNSFSFDAAKLELGKSADEPGSAGFQLDLLFGENANILGSDAGVNAAGRPGTFVRGPGDTGVFVQEAYVSYNAEGVLLKLGKFETILGYEVLDAPYNPHITHSELFFGAIPLMHTGVLASGEFGEGLEWAAGVVNGFNNAADFNDNKGVLGSIGYSDEGFSVKLNAFIGSEGLRASGSLPLTCAAGVPESGTTFAFGVPGVTCLGENSNRMYIWDVVATFTPAENIEAWAEATWGLQEIDSDVLAFAINAAVPPALVASSDANWFAAVLGGTFDVDDRTSISLRAEYFDDDGNFRLGHGAFGGRAQHYSGTITLAHKLTNNLLARVEYRHDLVDGDGSDGGPPGTADAVFFKHGGTLDDQQDIGIIEVSYIFD